MAPFDIPDIPDMKGKSTIVTGANGGIGYITALEMARKGAHVIVAARSKEKGEAAVAEIKKQTNNENVEFMELDLASLKSVKKFAEDFKAKNVPLHVLVNNAGVMMCPWMTTADGIELQFGTNHVGHFLLTNELLPILEANQPSRIVVVSSLYHTKPYSPEGVRLDKINDEVTYHPDRAYGQSKLANILYANELNKKLANKQIYVNSLHPGVVTTELTRHISSSSLFWNFVVKVYHGLVGITPENGARTQLYLATSPEVESKNIRGKYFIPYAQEETPTVLARDEKLGQRLWVYTEELLREKLGNTGFQSYFANSNEER